MPCLKPSTPACGTIFDWDGKRTEIARLQTVSEQPGFWDTPEAAAATMQTLDGLKQEIARFEVLSRSLQDAAELSGMADLEEKDIQSLEQDVQAIGEQLREWEFQLLLGGVYDHADAILTLRSGAGGTEAQDWTEMLLRMYLRYAERHSFRSTVLDENRGNETGLKSVTVEIRGRYAYGYLRGEMGVHRLVRLSPFNANNLRQTSFASVEVMPVLPDTDRSIEIKPEELRVDTLRASGAGGQHVNKTESAVRLTHLPSGIVVACQSERSQLQNRDQAMKLLKSKLLQKRLNDEEERKAAIRGEFKSAGFGNQIRSYVLHPYTLVKDHRTDTETSNTQAVLDGDLDSFIESELQYEQRQKK
ncbi:MAG: peptide chain release factor 2 [Candidatus Moraniibacteriota bacterium]|nr:MAG: peptide chain release factor 2 [Candidatus Moranbacteria bacterium]